LYYGTGIVWEIKSRKMTQVKHGENKPLVFWLLYYLMGRDHLGDQGSDGKCMLEKSFARM
jgi:hypothetical protein